MRNLNLSDWAHLSEIITSVAVIISLVYVGLELNQNTRALNQESYLNVIEVLADLDVARSTDADLNRIALLADKAPSDLSDEEWTRYQYYMLPRIGTWEYLYLAKQDDAVSEITWAGFDSFFRWLICSTGPLRFWEETQQGYSVPFREYVNTEVLNECGEQ